MTRRRHRNPVAVAHRLRRQNAGPHQAVKPDCDRVQIDRALSEDGWRWDGDTLIEEGDNGDDESDSEL